MLYIRMTRLSDEKRLFHAEWSNSCLGTPRAIQIRYDTQIFHYPTTLASLFSYLFLDNLISGEKRLFPAEWSNSCLGTPHAKQICYDSQIFHYPKSKL